MQRNDPARRRILEQLKTIVVHARRTDKIRGHILPGAAAWKEYLRLLEHNGLSTLPLNKSKDNVNLNLGVYCDGLCRIGGKAALNFYRSIAAKYHE